MKTQTHKARVSETQSSEHCKSTLNTVCDNFAIAVANLPLNKFLPNMSRWSLSHTLKSIKHDQISFTSKKKKTINNKCCKRRNCTKLAKFYYQFWAKNVGNKKALIIV